MTALHWAADTNRLECAKVLVAAGANLNALDNRGNLPLFYPLEHGFPETARLLLAAGAYSKPSYMVWAVRHGFTDLFNTMFAHHAPRPDSRKCITLSFKEARDNNRPDCLKTILTSPFIHYNRKFISLLKEGLLIAARRGYTDCFSALIKGRH